MNLEKKKTLFNEIFNILKYQFNEDFAQIFLSNYDDMKISFSKKTGKIKHIYLDDTLCASYKSQLGKFTLSLDYGGSILSKLKFPCFRVVVQNDISDFIREGKSVFSKHVINIDYNLNIGDEVFIVDEQDSLLAIGKLFLPSQDIMQFKDGCAVKVRKGVKSKIIKKLKNYMYKN